MDNFAVTHNIGAVARTDDVRVKELMPFSKMIFADCVRKGLFDAGFVYPTVIQATAIPVGKSGLDLLVQSKSGTGKTLIFCTILLDAYKSNVQEPQSLIIVPTREVAVQVEQVLNKIGKFCHKFKAVYIIGGMDVAEDRKRVQGAKAVVGTPGRILHLIQNEVLNTSQIKIMILDEADKMYSKNFRKDIEKIRKCLPNLKQIIACSATFENKLDEEIAKIMKNPLLISTEDRATLLLGIKQFVYELPEQKTSVLEMQLKLDALKHIFGRVAFKQCVIFAGSQSRAESYCNYLEKDGWPCELISGAQDQKTRLEQFQKFLDFKTRILFATDLMSRGVDSEHVNMVINLELPENSVSYLHRIGRAGRFGSHGIAISFVTSSKDRQTFKKLLSEIGTGMQALKFPSKTKCENDEKDVWTFDSFEDDVAYFGLYMSEAAPKAPLASQEVNSLTDTLSENSKNVQSNNTSTLQQSSININTFLINSKDSAVVVPPSSDFLQYPDTCKKKILTSPENENTACESLYDSSHQLITSNTIDDASSIAADSLRSSQQDVSKYRSVLMQKSSIPTLVEFLVDQQPSQDTHPKPNQNFFDVYTEEVLNDSDKQTEKEVSEDSPILTSKKLAQIKSTLIDKPSQLENQKNCFDMYSDFENFNEVDKSTSASRDVDKQTFILSVASPTEKLGSLEELNNNSSDLYPTTDETRVSTDSIDINKEPKHFPSPTNFENEKTCGQVLNQEPNYSKQQAIQQQKQTLLSINVTTHMEIPPQQISPDSGSQTTKAEENEEADSLSSNDGSDVSHSNEDIPVQFIDDENESIVGNSSGFDEKTSSSSSSGIATSEQGINILQMQMEQQYETSSDENEDYNSDEMDDVESSSSEHYFGTDENDSEDEDLEERSTIEEGSNEALHNQPANFPVCSSSNITDGRLDLMEQSAYSRWVDLYRKQLSMVQNYVKLHALSLQNTQN